MDMFFLLCLLGRLPKDYDRFIGFLTIRIQPWESQKDMLNYKLTCKRSLEDYLQ